ncbi:MAG: hypothetical protein ABIH99_05170 [Candidatus Micrarchaeota archaeon]
MGETMRVVGDIVLLSIAAFLGFGSGDGNEKEYVKVGKKKWEEEAYINQDRCGYCGIAINGGAYYHGHHVCDSCIGFVGKF